MRRPATAALTTASALVVLIVGASSFLPLIERQSDYCFYCGAMSDSLRLLGVPVCRCRTQIVVYDDTVKTPPHAHRMIGICGLRFWLFDGAENWDEFGWTGSPCRAALVAGLDKHPDRREEILREFLALDPQDDWAISRFIKAWAIVDTEPAGEPNAGPPLGPEADSRLPTD